MLSLTPTQTPVLAVNAWAGREQAVAVRQLRQALNAALAKPGCGLILDFSRNSGGNMWPMVIGLLPLLPDGTLGGFEDRDAQQTRIVSAGGKLLIDGSPHFLGTLDLQQPAALPQRLAIVVGDRTASSGEITALMFKGQRNAIFFGRPSAGIASANKVFALPNGGSIALTSAATLDRSGRRHTGPIFPDVASDVPVLAADQWVRSACTTRKTG